MTAGNQTVDDKIAAQSQQTPQAKPQRRAIFETGLIVLGFFLLFFVFPHELRGDDWTRLGDVNNLLQQGHLDNSRFSLIGPILSVPVLLLSHLTESRSWWAAHYNTIVVAVGVLIAYYLLRGRIDARLFRLSVLVLLFASFLTNRMRDYNAETVTAVLITVGIICLVTHRYVVLGWAAIVVGVINTPAAIVGLILLAAIYTVQQRRLRHLLPVAVAAAGIMLEAWIRRGGPFVTGYGHQGYSNPFVPGVLAILFSFGRGLIFFTPGLALSLSARVRKSLPGRNAMILMLAFLAGLILIYSNWWAWYGGLSWGPRFFTFAAIPASFLIAVGIWRAGQSVAVDALTLLVLTVSAWVAWTGSVANLFGYLNYCKANFGDGACFYVPQHSALYQPFVRFPHMTVNNVIITVLICGVFAYLAAPLAASVVRWLAPHRSWAVGWRV